MRITRWILAMASASLGGTALGAQAVDLPAGYAPGTAIGFGARAESWTAVTPASPLPTASKQEVAQLVSANVAQPAVALYGGQYVLTQSCAVYGSLTVRYRGPDGQTMLPLLTRSTADSAGGSVVGLGSNAVVDAVLSGTDGCDAQLARIP